MECARYAKASYMEPVYRRTPVRPMRIAQVQPPGRAAACAFYFLTMKPYGGNKALTLYDLGFTPDMLPDDAAGEPARVTAVHRERYDLLCDAGEIHGRLKRAAYDSTDDVPTTGDYVLIDCNPIGDSQILFTLPRKTFFTRRSAQTGRGGQAIAANFDTVFLMQSLNHDLNLKRMERYLALAWQSGAAPVILLTKADLADDCAAQTNRMQHIAVGVPVYPISVVTGRGMAELEPYIQPRRTIVFLGSSGVGKSSLVNALSGGEVMPVRDIREDDSHGRHTTTHRQMILLENGAMVIDTPGMRQMGMWDVDEGLDESFADVTQYAGRCRFDDCSHLTEPGCAIRAAIARGALSPDRWDRYEKLLSEAKYADDRAAYMRDKKQWHKGIAQRMRQREEDARKFGGKR